MSEFSRQAHAVLFPVFEAFKADDHISRFLDNGGRSLLFGEAGVDYVTGQTNEQRLQGKTLEAWHGAIEAMGARAGNLIFAADADISAVQRVQGIAAKLPSRDAAARMSNAELEDACFKMACDVFDAGINLALSPVADVLTGGNPLPEERMLADDSQSVSRSVRSYIRGARRAGLKTTLKYFRGGLVSRGQHASDEATVPLSLDELRAQWSAFRAGIEEGVSAVMLGPACFEAVHPSTAESLPGELIRHLCGELEFGGLVMTCELDHKAAIEDRSVIDTAIRALDAGADLLLLSPKAVPHIGEIAAGVVRAVESGRLEPARLNTAARAVYKLAGCRPV